MRRNLLSVPTLITPALSCPKNKQDMRLTWRKFRREFASDWLSFQNESTAVMDSINEPEVQARLKEMGLKPVGSSPAEFTSFIKTENDKWENVVKTGNIKAD